METNEKYKKDLLLTLTLSKDQEPPNLENDQNPYVFKCIFTT